MPWVRMACQSGIRLLYPALLPVLQAVQAWVFRL